MFERFRDYWKAQPGQRGVKADWFATWRNWCRNEKASAPLTAKQKADEAIRLMESKDDWMKRAI